MAKPQYVYLLEKRKVKVQQRAEYAKQISGQNQAEQEINVVDHLFKNARISSADVQSGLKMLEKAKESTQDKVESTTLGKTRKYVETAKKLAEEWLKLEESVKKTMAELRTPVHDVIKLPPMKENMPGKVYVDALEIVIVLLTIAMKRRKQG